MAYEDFRHLLKQQRAFAPDLMTPTGAARAGPPLAALAHLDGDRQEALQSDHPRLLPLVGRRRHARPHRPRRPGDHLPISNRCRAFPTWRWRPFRCRRKASASTPSSRRTVPDDHCQGATAPAPILFSRWRHCHAAPDGVAARRYPAADRHEPDDRARRAGGGRRRAGHHRPRHRRRPPQLLRPPHFADGNRSARRPSSRTSGSFAFASMKRMRLPNGSTTCISSPQSSLSMPGLR